MASDWEALMTDGMFVDCSTISVYYPANGLAIVSFTVYTTRENGAPYKSGGPGFELCVGNVSFKGWINQMSLAPNSEIELMEWRVTATAIGCRQSCNAGC